ncbi:MULTISPECIES: Rieske (2Fe-2S) protein [Roseomonadaceae]|uniref:Rieske 2Fe-2S domain-containing protein n=1 Tax=Falsiroseomonas oleicola TaxID=2801474 RepID=A0ABS6H5C1_9PROT|nr:Rieske 2Fe-2S domain-containing protein [Roseomonas oleicola]MBU8542948.1 Rieske 2Fe-2S domain-containing protein [Roseomonas oleicola]
MSEVAADERVLCRLADIPDGESRGFSPAVGAFTGLFAVRRGEQVFVYVNSCPHVGLPLDPAPHRFLDAKRSAIICAAHGARFRIEDGECTSGPCYGESLEAVPARLDAAGQVIVPAEAGL